MDASIIGTLIGVGALLIINLIAVAYWGGGMKRGLEDLKESFNKLPCQRDGADCPGEDCKVKGGK
jgi:hypothetical protein